MSVSSARRAELSAAGAPGASKDRAFVWIVFVVAGLATIGALGATTFGWVAPLTAGAVVALQWRRPPSGVTWTAWQPDTRDLRAIAQRRHHGHEAAPAVTTACAA